MIKRSGFFEILSSLRESVNVAAGRQYDRLVARLNDADVLENALKVGDRFPDFALPNGDGHFIQSAELFDRGPVIVTFYRGQWCPFCRAAVEAMLAAAPALTAMGASVIGITPEVGSASLCAGHKYELNFEMLCDLDNGVALECGLLFRLTDEIVRLYQRRGLDLKSLYGNGSSFLPIPASYAVDRDQTIRYAFLDADFRYRADPQDLLAALASITGHGAPNPPPNRASAPA